MATLDINDVLPEVDYTAIAAQTAFTVPFEFFADADLVVLVDGAVQALNTDYTVTGAEVEGGGSVTFTAGLAGGEAVRIFTDIAIARDVKYTQSGSLSHLVLERDMAKQIRISQQLERDIGRCIRLMQSDPAVSMELPSAEDRANKYLAFGASGELEVAEEVTGTTLSQSVIGGYLHPRTAAEIAVGVTPTHYYHPPGRVDRYALNLFPGTTDMTAAIQAAINQMCSGEEDAASVTFNGTLLHNITAGLTWNASETVIHGNSVRLVTSADIIGLDIGPRTFGNAMARAKLLGGLSLENTGSSTKPAVRINQCVECDIFIPDVLDWYRGIQLTSVYDSCAYNDIRFSRIKNCTYGFDVYNEGMGYVNENRIWCGRFTHTGTGIYHIYVHAASGMNRPNNNRFKYPCCEMASGAELDAYIWDEGISNIYEYGRYEFNSGTETLNVDKVVFGVGSYWNHIEGGMYLAAGNITDLGGRNTWNLPEGEKFIAANSGPAVTARDITRGRSNSNGVSAHVVRDMYDGSGNSMAYESVLARATTGGHHIVGKNAGDQVIGLNDGLAYECILAHTGVDGTNRPGKTVPDASWATYWRCVGHPDSAAAAWSATAYVAQAIDFKVAADGAIWTNQAIADTSNIPAASLYKLPIYNASGTLLGYIPIVTNY